MYLYLSIFAIPVFFLFFIRKNQRSTIFLTVYLLSLCIFVGIGDMLGGYDRYIYGELFDTTVDHIKNDRQIIESSVFLQYPKELGYVFLNIFVGKFSANRYIFILCLTILIYTLFYFSFRKYATNYPLAMVLFMGLMFFFTFTYLRQMIAVGFGSLAIKYVIDRKFWKFFFFILLAFSFHNSAIILFPLYFIPIRKYKLSTIIAVLSVCLFLGATGVSNSLFGTFGELTGAEDRTAGYEDETGFRIAYVLEAIFFLFFLLKGYSQIPNERQQLVLYNMALIFCAILFVFVKSENGGRLSWFYMIGLICAITNIVIARKSFVPVTLICIVSLFLYIRVYSSWQQYLNLYPYKTFFTNGYREGDYSFEHYEYDQNYVTDKFYR